MWPVVDFVARFNILTTMVVNNQAKELLIRLGLTEYESGAYLSLLSCQPATGYELAKVSGIPSSKIYETANRLVDKKLIEPVAAGGGRGQRYIAIGAEDFISIKREEVARQTNVLEPLLKAASNGMEADFIWQLEGQDAV